MTSVCMKSLSEVNFAHECKITAINPRGAKTYFVSNEHLTKHDIDRVTSRTPHNMVKIFLKSHLQFYYSRIQNKRVGNLILFSLDFWINLYFFHSKPVHFIMKNYLYKSLKSSAARLLTAFFSL